MLHKLLLKWRTVQFCFPSQYAQGSCLKSFKKSKGVCVLRYTTLEMHRKPNNETK